MVLHLKRLLALALLCITPFAHADLQRLQHLHELRSEGYVAGTYLLIDNNLYERVREPGNREAYTQALSNMAVLLRQLGNPDGLRESYDEFVRLIRELENQTEDEAHYNLATVNRIMMAHAKVDKAIAAEYQAQAVGAPEQLLALHQQSLETHQILLLYQNNMFSSIGVYFLDTEEGIFTIMDARITERSGELKRLLPEQTDTFSRLEKQYIFIQPRLLNYHTDWVPTIAAFYLLRNTQTLDSLAREQVRSAAENAS